MNEVMERAAAVPVPGRGRLPSARPAHDTPVRTEPDDLQVDGRDSYAVTAIADITDRSLHAGIARFTAGLSPSSLGHAYFDWLMHLVYSPGKRLQLVDKALRKTVRLANYMARHALEDGRESRCIEPLPQDKRFAGEDWHKWPYALIYQSFLLQQQWWHNATTGIRGVTRRHQEMV